MADIELREDASPGYAIVRGDAADAVAAALGVALPTAPNTVASGAMHDAWWLGPDEWMLVSKAASSLESTLRPLLHGRFAAVVDVSSGYTTLRLAGARAREVLQKGCPLDLHPRVFAAGACAQSHYFKAGIALRPIDEGSFEVIVRRSYAEYVVRMLRDAADC